MIKYLSIVIGMFIGSVANSAPVDDAVVYIECLDKDNKVVSKGSGVVVSENGHVLSARHVFFPKDIDVASCRGILGGADSNNASRLVVRNQDDPGFDAAIARFSKSGNYKPMQFCDFDDSAIRTRILVSGFPGGTNTGKPSFRAGIISTTHLDQNWMVETDGMSAAGMSGGPVVNEDGTHLIGLVAGADYNAKAEPTFYGVTPVSEFANSFRDLTGNGQSCGAAVSANERKLLEQIEELKLQVERLKNPFVHVSDLSKSHIVSISCGSEDTIKTIGTGLIVTNAGHVLTAGSMFEEGLICRAQSGSRGSADGYRLRFRQHSINGDALILQIDPEALAVIRPKLGGNTLSFRKVTSVDPGSEIAAIGFPTHEESGLATIERGYLATNFESDERTVEAALNASHGLIGAPILDANSDVIGIVASIEVENGKATSFISALSSDYIAEQFRHLIKTKD